MTTKVRNARDAQTHVLNGHNVIDGLCLTCRRAVQEAPRELDEQSKHDPDTM